MLDLVRRILQSFGAPVKSAEDWNLAVPALGRQSPLFSAVKRACQTLKALVDAGVGIHHAERMLKMYQRFNACIAPAEPPRPPESESIALASSGASAAVTSSTAKMRTTSTGSNRRVELLRAWFVTVAYAVTHFHSLSGLRFLVRAAQQ